MNTGSLISILLYRKVLRSRQLAERHRAVAQLHADQTRLATLTIDVATECDHRCADSTLTASTGIWITSQHQRIGHAKYAIDESWCKVRLAERALSQAEIDVEVVDTMAQARKAADRTANTKRDQIAVQDLISSVAQARLG